jgi:hypothetical protein
VIGHTRITTYEELLQRVGMLTRPDEPMQRNVHWLNAAHVIGISKTREGRIEIFLAGPALNPSSRTLRDAIEHQPWWRQGGDEPAFEANRLLLPGVGHFNQVAAFLCAELLRNGVEVALERAFLETEPILELAIERLRLSDGAFLGLTGELLLLGALCRSVGDAEAALVVDAWAGWQQSLRDFTWGAVGTEVKTTTRSTSTHQIQGTHQVELNGGGGGGQREEGLYLVSIGLQETEPHGNSFTVPDLVDRIIERLGEVGRPETADVFVARVREYGSGAGFGYDHRSMRDDPAFTRSFAVTFVRAYDMTDEAIAVLRQQDVEARPHVEPSSLRYTIRLPAQVSGDLNPVVGLNQAALAVLRAARRT